MSSDYPTDDQYSHSPSEDKGDATLPGGGPAPVRLRMQLGPTIGQVYTMVGNRLTVGRAQDNDIVLDDPQVSRHHARVMRRGDEIIVEDLGSTNGTLVNGRRIVDPHVLQPTETIAVGSSVFQVEGFSAPDTVGMAPIPVSSPPLFGVSSQPPPSPGTPAGREAAGTPWLAIGWVGGLLIVVVLILTLAGLTAWLFTRDRVQATPAPPSVFIQSPVAGSQVPNNQPIVVSATASDPNGVTHVELWVGGNVVDQQQSAIPEGQPTLPVTMRWTPTVVGGYTLEVRAYNSQGVTSAPTTVMITVVGEGGQGTVVDTPTPTTPSEPPTSGGTPVAVTTSDLNVREGPGQEYPILGLLPVDTGVEVSGKNPDGSWWQIVYPPGSTARAWIFAAFTRTGNTENVPVVQTPVPPTATFTPTPTPTITPSATASPTRVPTVTQTPTPTALAPVVEFRATQTTVNPGECTTLQWHIDFVRAAFLNGGEFNNYGITGPFGQVEACPTNTTTYVLRAETDGSAVERSVTVNVR